MQFEETTGLSDQEFMTWLYETYAPLLWGTAKRYCRKQALREEIIQEGMLHLLACVPRLRGLQKDKLPGDLAVTVRNTTYNLLKKEARDQKLFVPLHAQDLPDDGPTLEEQLEQTRREKIEEFQKKRQTHGLDFKLAGDEEEDNDPAEEPVTYEEEELEDYGRYEETPAVQNELNYRRRTGWISVFLTLSLEAVLVTLSLLVHITGAPPLDPYLYIGLHGFMLLFMMLVNHQMVGGGLASLARMQADGDSAAAVAAVAALAVHPPRRRGGRNAGAAGPRGGPQPPAGRPGPAGPCLPHLCQLPLRVLSRRKIRRPPHRGPADRRGGGPGRRGPGGAPGGLF